ncbi:outer membrane protein assembly factor BamB family protein, partial [Vibrio parahaemolyticus]
VYFSVGNRLYAVDLQRGALKWRFPSEGVFPTPIHGSPVISNGIVLFGAGDGMYGLDMQDGKQKWHYSLKSGVNSQPAAVGDVVYFGS